MESSQPPITNQLTDIIGLRLSGLFPKGKEPSIATLRNWTKLRHIPYHKIGHFIYFDPADVLAHIRTKLRVAANELDAVVVRRQRPGSVSTEHDGAILPRWSHAGREPFKISNFKNPRGGNSFRVSGWLHGVRIRRNFKTSAEAEAERQLLELQRLDAANKLRTVVTRLTNDQLREAEAAYQRIGDKPRESLSFYVDHALAHYRELDKSMVLATAVTDYVAGKTKEQERTLISVSQLRSITGELETLKAQFPDGVVSQFTPEVLTAYLERGKPSLKTYHNRRGLISTFFKFARRKGWIQSNPVKRTPHYRLAHRRGSATTLAAERVEQLMAFLETYEDGTLVPYFALCLFAGVRPCFREGEMSRLQPESINLDTGVIHIEPEVSKVRMKRLVTIQPNLAAWLHAYPLKRYSIVPPKMAKRHRFIFRKFELSHDILRHTFISMFVGKYRSIAEAALQAGNSEEIIRRHYLDLKSTAEAEKFFQIVPTKGYSIK
ncbi:MAG TPA: site-specific integrase [Opitutaceae bacterium]|nr:site-specific integrase [Opitutaceae bacterium]